MSDRREFLGIGAALSSLPIPRQFDLQTDGGEPAVEDPPGTDDVVAGVPATSYVEQFTGNGGVRVRPHPGQNEDPVEVILRTPIGEVAVGLDPSEAREVAAALESAVDECQSESTHRR